MQDPQTGYFDDPEDNAACENAELDRLEELLLERAHTPFRTLGTRRAA